MGLHPSTQEKVLKDASIDEKGRHDVLLDNFLNAQCTIHPFTDS